jgi:hypothetical protein
MQHKERLKQFKNKVCANPLSTIIQLVIIILLVAVLCTTFKNDAPDKEKTFDWSRIVMFGAAVALILVQCIRAKCPMLIIDRIFANSPGKQVVLAFFTFVFTVDLAMCMFPKEGIRSSFVNIISYVKLTHVPDDDYHFQENPTPDSDCYDDFRIIKDPKPSGRWDYFKHVILYCLGLIVFNGLLIATITRVMATRAERYKNGANTYHLNDHYVIIGYGTSCVPIISNLCKRRLSGSPNHFLILTNQDIGAIRRDIKTQLQTTEEKVVIYSGDMNSAQHLQRLNLDKAKEVFIIGELQETGRDSKNIECAKMVKEIRQQSASTETLHVSMQFDKPTSYSTIKRITIPKDFYKDSEGREVIYLRPFNFYENWARLLWGTHQLDGYKTLDRGMMAENDKHVHLFIAGFNEMGVALLLEALRICHYPNYNEQTGANKTQITIVDPEMADLLPRFKSQYPYLNQIKDIDIDFRANRFEDAEIREMIDRVALQEDTLLTVAICFLDSDSSLSAALTLPDSAYYHVINGKVIPNEKTEILVRQANRSGFADLLDEENGKYANVKVFGTLDQGVDDMLLSDNMAIIISAYYHFKYELTPSQDFFEQVKVDKDTAFAEAARNWIALNQDKRFANRYQSEIYKTYQTYQPLLEQNPDLLYQTEHMRWSAERTIAGYRDMHEANIKDGTYQLHNLIVPYHDLNDHEKGKDKDVLEIMEKVMALAKTIESRII